MPCCGDEAGPHMAFFDRSDRIKQAASPFTERSGQVLTDYSIYFGMDMHKWQFSLLTVTFFVQLCNAVLSRYSGISPTRESVASH